MKKIDLLTILKTTTFKQSAISSIATVINGTLGIIFYIIMARLLGVENFGIFSVAILTSQMMGDIANVGTDTGIVRFVGQYAKTQPYKAQQFLKLGLKVKIIASLIMIIGGILVSDYIVVDILQKPQLLEAIRISILGSGTLLLFSYSVSALQALQKFFLWGVVNISLNFIRLALIGALSIIGALTLQSSITSYMLLPLFGFFFALVFLPKFWKVKNEGVIKSEFFNYNKWVAIFILIAAISSRLDTYIATKLLDLKQVGIYSVAVSLSAVGAQIIAALATVSAPKMAQFSSHKDFVIFFKKFQIFVIFLSLAGIAAGLAVALVGIPIFYGLEYKDAIVPFIILVLAQAIFLFSVPIHIAVTYYFSYPKLFVWVTVVHLMIIAVIGWNLIRYYGVMGAALTVLVGNISNLVIPAVWIYNRKKK